MAVLAGLGAVDWVVSFAEDTPERLLEQVRPDVLVKGGDYGVEQVVGAQIVKAYGGGGTGARPGGEQLHHRHRREDPPERLSLPRSVAPGG